MPETTLDKQEASFSFAVWRTMSWWRGPRETPGRPARVVASWTERSSRSSCGQTVQASVTSPGSPDPIRATGSAHAVQLENHLRRISSRRASETSLSTLIPRPASLSNRR